MIRLMSIEIAPEAARFVKAKGGRLYVWVDPTAQVRWATYLPRIARLEEWNLVSAQGVEVAVGRSASAASWWRVRLRHFPWRRLDVASDVTARSTGSSTGVH
jgi:hypothetical protein